MEYLAHLNKTGVQTVRHHLLGAADRAEKFAEPFGSGALARACAMLHDAGKYSAAFQKRIRGADIRVDHSTAGAQEAYRGIPALGKLLAYCVAGHHGGIPDGGTSFDLESDATLGGRLKRPVEPFDAYYRENGPLPRLMRLPVKPIGKGGNSIAFFVRMLFSCLVDADFLDTEAFMSGGGVDRRTCCRMDLLWEKLQKQMENFSAESPINQKRREILEDCLSAAPKAPGLFTLTAPTGGGKTLSSLAFALRHLLERGMSRIIYVIPYTSIIEQNAGVFAQVLGAENVLQHHSGFDFGADDDGIGSKQKLAAENWDMPVIVTTNVQFFESLFSNRPSRCRKLHHIANSALIFDEAQMLPQNYLLPCVRAISELVTNYRCTAVLCSATQPALEPFFPPGLIPREICRDPAALNRFFRRTKIVFRGTLSNEQLSLELQAARQALCIVSTRAHARDLYESLAGEGNFHLSTSMCPAHRKAVIQEIRRRLDAGEPCRVVSTQLIEAGVDVDFPAVYRSIAGLDSLIQSAGRCNREGRGGMREVFVFEPGTDYKLPPGLGRPIEITRGILREYQDPLSLEAIRAYFAELYRVTGKLGLDAKDILGRMEEGAGSLDFPFAQVSDKFKLIEEDTQPLVVRYDGTAKEKIAKLKKEGVSREILRELQPYTVTVFTGTYRRLVEASAVDTGTGVGILAAQELYDKSRGLLPSGGSGAAIFI